MTSGAVRHRHSYQRLFSSGKQMTSDLDAVGVPHRIEIRLLGPLVVRRADGELMRDRDWRSTKNAELLRWLALQAGDPVPLTALTDGLWPGTDHARARGSLRTALAGLRRALGPDVVERVGDSLRVTNCWVDASAFRGLARDVGRHAHLGRADRALAAARAADALYTADVPVTESAPRATAGHATALAAAYRALLGDAADAALQQGLMQDAVEFGTRLLDIDAVSERASRAVMLGYAGVGEMHHALQEYERCRRTLAEQLGVDPSPQTRAVHLQVLVTGTGPAPGASSPVREDDPSGRAALARALPRLEGDALDALQLAAVLDRPLTATLLAPLLGDDPASAASRTTRAVSALEQLVDLTLLRSLPAGAVLRHPLLRDAVCAWMRPSALQRVHGRVASRGQLPTAVRVGHWLRAGERQRACVAALEAAAESSALGDHAGTRAGLLEVCSVGYLPDADSADQADLHEALGDACHLLGRAQDAAVAYGHALEIALDHGLPQVAQLRRKREGATPRALGSSAPRPTAAHASVLAGLGVVVPDEPAALEGLLQDAIAQADRREDPRAAVRARLQMAAAVRLPRREFRAVHELVEDALRRRTQPSERLQAVLVRHTADVLSGGARTARDPLERAGRAAEAAGEERLWWQLLGMRVLVAHDLGDPGFDALWGQLCDRVHRAGTDDLVPELATVCLRVLVEREEFDLAATMSSHLEASGAPRSLLVQHLARLAQADLEVNDGAPEDAATLLRSVIDSGTAGGCTLLVPEAAARLVVLEASHDPAAARAAFEVYDEVVGAALGGPREECWRRLSRAAVRSADGDRAGAADAFARAGALAGLHGLQVIAGQARRLRAEHTRRVERPVVLPAVLPAGLPTLVQATA